MRLSSCQVVQAGGVAGLRPGWLVDCCDDTIVGIWWRSFVYFSSFPVIFKHQGGIVGMDSLFAPHQAAEAAVSGPLIAPNAPAALSCALQG